MNKKRFLLIGIIAAGLITLLVLSFRNARLFPQMGQSGSLSASLAKASGMEAAHEFLGAKEIYQKLINEFPNSRDLASWQKKIESLNISLLFSSQITPRSISYQVKSGDTLTKIAKAHNTTIELIKRSNGLAEDKIVPGQKIKLWTAPFSILVDKSQNTLILKSDEEVFKTYIVSTGTNNCTPVGNFKIVEKIPNPTWFKEGSVIPPDSPENILGTRWLGFDLAGYGIHGTTEPQKLGKQVTQGCVRMSNPEVEELYIIVPKGTEVTITD